MTISTMQSQRHALVTGASKGIGVAIAKTLAQAGFHLTLLGRNEDRLEKIATALKPFTQTQAFTVDITDQLAIQAVFHKAIALLGPVHILVNNAGQAISQPFEKTTLALWQKMLDVNLTGTFNCTQAVLPSMLEAAKQGISGRIINISSTAGLQGYAYVTAYSAAKHGVIGLTRALALELARKGITVNAICPGYTETDLLVEAIEKIVQKTGKTAEQARQTLASKNPQQRLVQPEEVARAVLWLCSSGSDAINGQAIAIDGGELAG